MSFLGFIHKQVSNTISGLFGFVCKQRIKNDRITILCPNCIGGVIYNRIGKEFCSPTVNTAICESDFIKFVFNYKTYLSQELQFVSRDDCDYPCALLGDILIRFVHSKTIEEARADWYRRLERINWDNIYIVLYEIKDTTREDIISFSNIPCKKIIVLTQSLKNSDINYVRHMNPSQGNALSPYFLNRNFWGIRAFELQWDFVKWLNS